MRTYILAVLCAAVLAVPGDAQAGRFRKWITESITTLQGLTARVTTLEQQVRRLDALVRRLTGLV